VYLSARMVREGVAGGLAPEPDARALAQAAQLRRVLAALGPGDPAVALGTSQQT
jgi:hypothetical protein